MLSVVIPTLNEAENLQTTIGRCRWASEGAAIEFIVSDCNSTDGTVDVARECGAATTAGGTSRADAMNRGLALATGENVLFLHADTLPPRGFVREIDRVLDDPSYVGGAFDFEFRSDLRVRPRERRLLQWVVLCNRLRYRWSGNFYGDQAIFARRDVLLQAGGFPNVRLMEDIRLSQRLRHFGKTAILRPPVLTSPRRFIRRGIVRQFMEDLAMLSCESLGICPHRMWAAYNGMNLRADA